MVAPRVFQIANPSTSKTLHTPASNTSAIVTLAAVAEYKHIIDTIFWSYSGGTPVGRITITDAGVTVLDFDITEAGPAYMPLMMEFSINTQIIVTLAAGGIGVTGKLTVVHFQSR